MPYAAPLPQLLLIADPSLPLALFTGRALYDEFAPDRRRYEAAVTAYALAVKPTTIRGAAREARALGYNFITQRAVRESAEAELREALLALAGFSEDDVEWHIANPGKRDAIFIADAADVRSGCLWYQNETNTGARGKWRGSYTKKRAAS